MRVASPPEFPSPGLPIHASSEPEHSSRHLEATVEALSFFSNDPRQKAVFEIVHVERVAHLRHASNLFVVKEGLPPSLAR
jgi:hypothetical protein